jgi:Ca-activated chloride channel family protein
MKTKLSLSLLSAVCFCAAMVGRPVQAAIITLTAEVDKPLLLAEKTQTAYLRIGLTGCPLEKLKQRTPVNVALVIDKSGSMSGERIRHAREAAILALDRLNSEDIVSVVAYDSEVQVIVPATKLTRRDDIIRKIRQIEAGGFTALYAGVQTGAEEVRKFQSSGRTNRIVLLSDGQANVGPQTTQALGKLGAQLAEKGMSVTTIGLGMGYNEDLMSRLAYNSDGGHYFAETPNELASVFDREFDRALSVVAQQVRLEIVCGEHFRPVRVLGREGLIKDRTILIDIGQIYSSHEKYALVEIEIPGVEAVKTREIANVRLSYKDMNADTPISNSGQAVEIRFTPSQADSDKSINHRVMADVVEQIAIEQNERATALRDEGKVEQARQVLYENTAYLRSHAASLNSPALEKYAAENSSQAEQLDESSWNRNRKLMVEGQSARKSQR